MTVVTDYNMEAATAYGTLRVDSLQHAKDVVAVTVLAEVPNYKSLKLLDIRKLSAHSLNSAFC